MPATRETRLESLKTTITTYRTEVNTLFKKGPIADLPTGLKKIETLDRLLSEAFSEYHTARQEGWGHGQIAIAVGITPAILSAILDEALDYGLDN